jgi:dolichol-phosphate mannosyltransferase
VHLAGIDYRVAAGLAFLVAVTNNFLLNRHWTFDARHGHAGSQAARFLAVSLAAFAFNLLWLLVLVDGFAVAKVPAQAVAIAIATPVSFLGNKLWSFRK